MDIEQAINMSIQYETMIRDIYQEGAGNCIDETGQRVLQVLAQEEQQHLDYLSEKLREWKQAGKVTPVVLESIIPSKRVITESIIKFDSNVSTADCSDDAEILATALLAEIETSRFYKQLVAELDAEGQALFEPFIEIEEGHLMIVQAELDNLKGLGYWFDFREFDLEAG
jgi:rubrerythrin